MKETIRFIIYTFLVSMFVSCSGKISQEDLIASAVELKITQWKSDQMKTCTAKAMVEAETFVDSMLIIYSLSSKLDTIPKPPKPNKPFKPTFRIKPDSVIVDTL